MQHISITQFLQYYSKVKNRTRKVIALITEKNIDYAFSDGLFSLGDLARHIPLVELYFYLPVIRGCKPTYSGCGASFAPDTASILTLYDEAESQLRGIMEGKPAEFLKERISMPGGEISLHKWLRLILEHEIHHRGQIYQLLSANGAQVPHIFGLSSEDLIQISTENED